MFATVSTVDVDDSAPIEERARRLNEEMVPTVKGAPGFVSAYWLAPMDGQGLMVALWESEEAARQFASTRTVGEQVQPGVTLRSIHVRPVIASA